jgi:N6-adenosine-specific RNA methylase IME4
VETANGSRGAHGINAQQFSKPRKQNMIQTIKVTEIDPSPFQHRRHFAVDKLKELAKSIERDGLLQPVTVRKQGKRFELIAGERRLRAVREYTTLDAIECRVIKADDMSARRLCAAENLQRDDLSAIEEVGAIVEMVDAELVGDAEYLEKGETPEARVKAVLGELSAVEDSRSRGFNVKDAAVKTYNKFIITIEEIFSNLPKPVTWRGFYNNDLGILKIPQEILDWAIAAKLNKQQTKELAKLDRAVIAKNFTEQDGVLVPKRESIFQIVSASSEPVESIREMSAKEIAGLANNEKKFDRMMEIERQREAIENGTAKLPEGVYEVVAMDPPWAYGREYDPESSRVANPYPEMSQEQLLELKPPFADDCVLFLWTTHAFLFDAKQLMDAWGFTYKATMVWDKEKIGMGAWLRMQCEFCLVGIKGKPIWNNTTWRDIIREPRREHSRKPDTFYEMAEQITVGRRLDFFSREQRNGWEVFGNDTAKF